MQQITRFQTYDGEVHETEKKARRYLDRKYGEVMAQIAHKLCHEAEWRYHNLQEVIDQQLEVFVHLSQIKADMALENPEREGRVE